MPLPTPNIKETKSDFISRCMSAEITNKDFPNTTQRIAVCVSAWDKKTKTKKTKSNE